MESSAFGAPARAGWRVRGIATAPFLNAMVGHARTESIPYEDLLALPYVERGDDPNVGLDCFGQMREVHKRLGFLSSPDEARDVSGIADLARVGLEVLGTDYRLATRLGDVLVSDPKGGSIPSHVSTLVEMRGPLFLSVQHNRDGRTGMPFLLKGWAVAQSGTLLAVLRPSRR